MSQLNQSNCKPCRVTMAKVNESIAFVLLFATLVAVWADGPTLKEETLRRFAELANISLDEAKAFDEMRNAIKPPNSIESRLEAIGRTCEVFTNTNAEQKSRQDWEDSERLEIVNRLRVALSDKNADWATRMNNFRSACSTWSYS